MWNLKFFLPFGMREDISCVPPPFPPSVPHSILPLLSLELMRQSQMFMTDEMGEGSDVIPSPICICCVASPALVSTRLWNTRGACGGDVCRRERYKSSPTGTVIRKTCKNYRALREFHLSPFNSLDQHRFSVCLHTVLWHRSYTV